MCCSRIKKVVELRGVLQLIKALESSFSSTKTKHNAALAMKQICTEETVRGKVIAQGGLRATMSAASNKSLEPEVRRFCAHALAKLLVTTNSTLLSSHNRIDSIKPLLHLCNEDSYTYLEHFEALMSLTNITSCGELEQNAFVAQKGVTILKYLMACDHPAVVRAAVELMCNVSSHNSVVEMYLKRENLRLLFSFCSDWACDLDEDVDPLSDPFPLSKDAYKTARAALGMLAGLCSNSTALCQVAIEERILVTIINMLGSLKYELIHRAMVVLLGVVTACKGVIAVGKEEVLGDNYMEGVSGLRLLEAAVVSCFKSLRSMKQCDEATVTMLEDTVAKQLLHLLKG
jgi:hypothetical protein